MQTKKDVRKSCATVPLKMVRKTGKSTRKNIVVRGKLEAGFMPGRKEDEVRQEETRKKRKRKAWD